MLINNGVLSPGTTHPNTINIGEYTPWAQLTNEDQHWSIEPTGTMILNKLNIGEVSARHLGL